MKVTKRIFVWVAALMLLVLNVTPGIPVMAVAPGTIIVQPSVINGDLISAGSSKEYTINVDTGSPLQLEVSGLAQNPGGSIQPLPPEMDTSSQTARNWITLDKSLLPAGENQPVHVTMTVPGGTAPGEKYAALYFHTIDSGDSGVALITGVIIPIIIIVDSTSFTPVISGQITAMEFSGAFQSQPLEIFTTFENTGNVRIVGSTIKITIKNNAQAIIWENQSLVDAPSIMPGFPRTIYTRYANGLNVGGYTATATISLTSGVEYTFTRSFNVLEAAVPVMPVPISPGAGTAPGPLVDTLTPLLQWNTVFGAETYLVSVKRDPFSASDVVYESNALNVPNISLPANTLVSGVKYRWEVTASNVIGTSQAAIMYFQTGPIAPTSTIPPTTTMTAPPTTTTNAPTTTTTNSIPTTPPSTTTARTTVSPTTITQPAVTTVVTDARGLLPPEIVESSIRSVGFQSGFAGYLDGRSEAAIELFLTGNEADGSMSAGRFNSEPNTGIPFAAGTNQGGTGKSGIKFVGVAVSGSNLGVVTVKVYYNPDEIRGFDETSLFLAYFSMGRWYLCTNTVVSPAERFVSGEVPVSRLGGTIIGLGGKTALTAPANSYSGGSGLASSGSSGWMLAVIVGGTAAAVLGVILVMEMRRRKVEES